MVWWVFYTAAEQNTVWRENILVYIYISMFFFMGYNNSLKQN